MNFCISTRNVVGRLFAKHFHVQQSLEIKLPDKKKKALKFPTCGIDNNEFVKSGSKQTSKFLVASLLCTFFLSSRYKSLKRIHEVPRSFYQGQSDTGLVFFVCFLGFCIMVYATILVLGTQKLQRENRFSFKCTAKLKQYHPKRYEGIFILDNYSAIKKYKMWVEAKMCGRSDKKKAETI